MRASPLVLLVDDDPDTREMYAWSLTARGFDVVSAGTVSQAVAIAQAQRPDAIVTDFTLPGEDGFVLGERVRAVEPLLPVPLLLVSGRAFVGDSGGRASALFDRILLKPVLPDQLIAEIAAAMLSRTSETLQRQLTDVRTRLATVPRTSDASGILDVIEQVATDGDMPAALLADSSAQYIAVNDAACALTGRSREELLSLRIWDLAPPSALAQVRRAWDQFVESGTSSGAYVLRAPSGKEIETRFAASTDIVPGCHLSLLQSISPALRPEAR
jgi:DNA-binding response OmpR family regulator